jgi:hypothetical protein
MISPCLFFALALYSPAEPDAPVPNPLVNQLIKEGLPLPGGALLKLPPPFMTDGMTAEQQAGVLKKATENIPLENFTARSETAPISQKVTSQDDPAHERRIQSVDVAFIAYADLKVVQKQESLDPLLEGDHKDRPVIESALSPAALKKRGIKPLSEPGVEERYYPLEFTLLERVRITGATHTVRTRTADGLLAATVLDPRFAKDDEFPDQWRLIDRIADTLGAPHVYTGLAGYVKITELKEPAGALFIELHYALEDPYEWYDKKNVLSSKLPTAVNEKVHTFRRKLAKASAGN